MKILLLNPPFKEYFSRSSRSPAVSKGRTLYYPIWLCYCAGVLDQAGFEVKLVDAIASKKSLVDIEGLVKEFMPDLIVIETSTPSIHNDIFVLEVLKVMCPQSFTVLVGTHVSALPEWTLGQSAMINAVAVREYDYIIRDLAKTLESKGDIYSLKGLYLRSPEGTFVFGGEYDLIDDLDSLPFITKVYKKYLNTKDYFFAAAEFPMVMIITGRGCPFKCFFCVYPQTFHSRRYRLRSAENVVSEFKYVKETFPEVKEIGIEDDTFTANKKRTIEICKLLVEKNIKIKFYANVRSDLDYETMKWMKRAGCRLLTVGFETGNDNLLKDMHKGICKRQSLEFEKNARKVGLLVHGCIIVGNPGETKQTMEESFQFAIQLNCDSFQFYPLFPYPGTECYKWAKENNYLVTEDFNKWIDDDGNHNCVLSTPNISKEELVEFCNKAYRRYHLRPRYLVKKSLQLLVSPSEGIRSLKAGVNYFSNVLKQRLLQ